MGSVAILRQPCRHLHQDRGACMDCGRVFSEGRPAVRLLKPTYQEERAELREVFREYVTRSRGLVLGLVDVIAFYMALRDRDRGAVQALDRVVEELVDFDHRCELGDVEGAVQALRGFIARIGGRA